MIFTSDEKTLLLLYYEDNRTMTIRNLTTMRDQLQSDEKELYQLTSTVLSKLFTMTEQEFQALDVFEEMR